MHDSITVLMATYNGNRFVSEQIDSLLRQTVCPSRIVISDDGSTDGTLETLEQYANEYPNLIRVCCHTKDHGTANNFLSLMTTVTDDYVLLCDQDDVWLPTKIEQTLAAMKEAEQAYGSIPLLVHTDLCVTDEYLQVLDTSFRECMNADYSRVQLRDQVIQNTMTGCTALYNRALADMIRMPTYCVMHDWWLQLIAAAFGRIVPIYQPTMLYRQHGNNVIGAKRVKSIQYLLKRAFAAEDVKRAMQQTYLQAKSFLNVYTDKLSAEQKEFLLKYSQIPQYGKIQRLRQMRELGVHKTGLVRQLGQILYG